MAKIPVFVFTNHRYKVDDLLDKYSEHKHKEWVYDDKVSVADENSDNIKYELSMSKGGALEISRYIFTNPNGKWDYYHIIDTGLPEYPPFAFITPDGKWVERGTALYFLQVADDIGDEEWDKIWNDAIEKYGKKGYQVKIHF